LDFINYCTVLLGFGHSSDEVRVSVCSRVSSSVKGSGSNGMVGNGTSVGDRCGNSLDGRGGNSMVSIGTSNGNRCSNSVVGYGNGLVNGDVVLVNDGGLDNLLDGMDLVGLGNGIGLGNLNGVRFGNMFLNDDFSFDGDGDGNRDLDGVFVYLKLGFDAGHLGCDDRMGSDGGLDFGDGDGISWGGSLVGRCWGDGSIRSNSGNDRGSDWDSAFGSLGGFSNVGVCRGLADLGVLSVGMASLDSLGSNLDGAVSNDLVCGVCYWCSSMDMFLDRGTNNCGGTGSITDCVVCYSNGCGNSMVSQRGNTSRVDVTGVTWGRLAQSHQ
jgi:hypothetical protein